MPAVALHQIFNSFPAKFQYIPYVNLNGLFICIKYIVFSILYRRINTPMVFKELFEMVELLTIGYDSIVAKKAVLSHFSVEHFFDVVIRM